MIKMSDSRPIPKPRQSKTPTPIPRARTKVNPPPQTDILNNITFTSPLQSSTPTFNACTSSSINVDPALTITAQLYPDSTHNTSQNSSPSRDNVANISIDTNFPASVGNSPYPRFVPSQSLSENSYLRTSSVDSTNAEYTVMHPIRSSYENVSLNSKPPNIPPPPIPREMYTPSYQVSDTLPPNIPPPPLPDESTYDFPPRLDLNNSKFTTKSCNDDITNSNISPNTSFSEVKSKNAPKLDLNFELRSTNNEPVSRKPTQSILINFDPLFENLAEKSRKSSNLLDEIFGVLNNNSEYKSDIACSLPQVLPRSTQNKSNLSSQTPEISQKSSNNAAKSAETYGKSPNVPEISQKFSNNSAKSPKIPEKPSENPEIPLKSSDKNPNTKISSKSSPEFAPKIPERTPEMNLSLRNALAVSTLAPANNSNEIENACYVPLENLYDTPESTEGYAKINKLRQDDDEAVPKPPERMDSIPREDFNRIQSAIIGNFNRNSLHSEPETEKTNKKLGKFKSVKNFTKNILQKNTNSMASVLLGSKPIGRPIFSDVNFDVHYTGVLVQPGRDRSEWGVTLSKGWLKWISDKAEHELNIQNITSLAAFNPAGSTTANQSSPMFCMEISSVNERQVQQMQLFSTPLTKLRCTWLQKLLESITSVFPSEITRDFTRAGWLNIKEGVSGSWVPCWMLLREREIFYSFQPDSLMDADLRKARCIIPQASGGLLEDNGCILVELHGRSLYIQAPNERDTNRWGHSIRAAAFNNGELLHEQQLTKDNVPVIVEKCINFVAQQGAITEGIYRRSGVQSTVSALLTEFKKDAWSVQLSRVKYSEHEVATALKRFFKDLPEPLIALDLTPQLCRVAALSEDDDTKVDKYRCLLQQLTPIHYVTSRKLFSHLHFLHLESKKNLMPAKNLAAIWGISLMHQQPTQAPLGDGQCKVVTDIIILYPKLYDVAESEILREMKMLSVVEKFHSTAPSSQPISKPSGDLRLWIFIGNPGSTDMTQIAVGPHKTASQVCEELGRGADFILQEFVMGGALARPLHPSEKVLEVVARWGYWDEADRKDNQLVLSPCKLYQDIKPLAKPPLMACSELKFADNKNKNFKTCVLELTQAKLACFKDRKLSSRNLEWNIEDIVWYLGHEPKRDPMTKWSVTFVARQTKAKRSKECPYFGFTMGGNIEEELHYWCAAMFLAEYPDGL